MFGMPYLYRKVYVYVQDKDPEVPLYPLPTGAPVNISGKPRGCESYGMTSVGGIIYFPYRTPCASQNSALLSKRLIAAPLRVQVPSYTVSTQNQNNDS